MPVPVYRFVIAEHVPMAEVGKTLKVSLVAVDSLVGQAAMTTDANCFVDTPRRTIYVDGTTHAGVAIARIFAGFLLREFGADAFKVQHPRTPGAPGTPDAPGAHDDSEGRTL